MMDHLNELSEEERKIYDILDKRGLRTLSHLAQEFKVSHQTLIKLNCLRFEEHRLEARMRNLGINEQRRKPRYSEEEKHDIQRALYIAKGSTSAPLHPRELEEHFKEDNERILDKQSFYISSPPSSPLTASSPECESKSKHSTSTSTPVKCDRPYFDVSSKDKESYGEKSKYLDYHVFHDTNANEIPESAQCMDPTLASVNSNLNESLNKLELLPLTPPWSMSAVEYDTSTNFSFVYDPDCKENSCNNEMEIEVESEVFVDHNHEHVTIIPCGVEEAKKSDEAPDGSCSNQVAFNHLCICSDVYGTAQATSMHLNTSNTVTLDDVFSVISFDSEENYDFTSCLVFNNSEKSTLKFNEQEHKTSGSNVNRENRHICESKDEKSIKYDREEILTDSQCLDIVKESVKATGIDLVDFSKSPVPDFENKGNYESTLGSMADEDASSFSERKTENEFQTHAECADSFQPLHATSADSFYRPTRPNFHPMSDEFMIEQELLTKDGLTDELWSELLNFVHSEEFETVINSISS